MTFSNFAITGYYNTSTGEGYLPLILRYQSPIAGGRNSWDVLVFDPDTKEWRMYPPEYIGEAIMINVSSKSDLLVVFREARDLYWDHYQYGPFLFTGLVAGNEYLWDAGAGTLNGQVKENLAYTGEEFVLKGTVTGFNEGPDYIMVTVEEAISGRLAPYFEGSVIRIDNPPVPPRKMLGVVADFTLTIVPVSTDYGQDWALDVVSMEYNYGWPDYMYEHTEANTGANYGTILECRDVDYGWTGDLHVLCDLGRVDPCDHVWSEGFVGRYNPISIVVRKWDDQGRSAYFYRYPEIEYHMIQVRPGQGFETWVIPYQHEWPGVDKAEAEGWKEIRSYDAR